MASLSATGPGLTGEARTERGRHGFSPPGHRRDDGPDVARRRPGPGPPRRGQAGGGERERCDKLFAAGNYKDAYEGYRRLALDPKTEPDRVGADLTRAIECLGQLGRVDEIDDFREAVIAVHKENWRLLQAAAESYLNDASTTASSSPASSSAASIAAAAATSARTSATGPAPCSSWSRGSIAPGRDPDRAAAGRYLLTLAQALMGDRAAERLLAAPDPHAARRPARLRREPVSALGRPAVRGTRRARRDAGLLPRPRELREGQERRRALAMGAGPGRRGRPRPAQHDPLDAGRLPARPVRHPDDRRATGSATARPTAAPEASGPYALDTLTDDETIARLATGIKRFKLPDEFNSIKIYQAIADAPKTGHGEEALDALAPIFENRRQFDRAAEYLKRSHRRPTATRTTAARHSSSTRSSATGASSSRRGPSPPARGDRSTSASATAAASTSRPTRSTSPSSSNDVKAYLTSTPQPARLAADQHRQHRLSPGRRRTRQQYLGETVAALGPGPEAAPGHFDDRITVTTPLQKAGAYLLTAQMAGGNTSRIIVWLADTVIVKKPLDGQGVLLRRRRRAPASRSPQADVEFFGWRMVQVDGKNEFRVETKTLSRQDRRRRPGSRSRSPS